MHYETKILVRGPITAYAFSQTALRKSGGPFGAAEVRSQESGAGSGVASAVSNQ
jgi:hypothetical protein